MLDRCLTHLGSISDQFRASFGPRMNRIGPDDGLVSDQVLGKKSSVAINTEFNRGEVSSADQYPAKRSEIPGNNPQGTGPGLKSVAILAQAILAQA